MSRNDLARRPIGNVGDPSFSDLIVNAIERELEKLHIGLPARVVKFHDEARVDVQPLLRSAYMTPAGNFHEFELPVIKDVPVFYPAGGGYVLKFPLKPGDIVYLSFADKSMDEWLYAPPGDSSMPTMRRKFDLNDAVAFPSIRQFSDTINVPEDKLTLGREDGTSVIEFVRDEYITIFSPAVKMISASADNSSNVTISPEEIKLGTETQPTVLAETFQEKMNAFIDAVQPLASAVVSGDLGVTAAAFGKGLAAALIQLKSDLELIHSKRVVVE